jgi:hypothetical protein
MEAVERRVNQPRYSVAEFQFVIPNRMAADHGAICFRHFGKSAAHDLLQDFSGARRGERDDGERRNRAAAHGVHIA